jgi:hypothetical protein
MAGMPGKCIGKIYHEPLKVISGAHFLSPSRMINCYLDIDVV